MEIREIPAQSVNDRVLRVCAYCRVSSKHEEQESSIENQIRHYTDLIGNDPRYEFAGVYYDSGISGKKDKRPEFQRMLEDARAGKFDMICTKSISRFARNTDTMLSAVRELKKLGIGIYFELQNMNTLNMDGEILLTVYAAFAQAESDTSGDLLRMSHQRRASEGNHNACFAAIYGYSLTDGVVYPNEEARWVKRIFELAAEGNRAEHIKRYLNAEGLKSRFGREFSATVVRKILRNPTYRGDIIRPHYYLGDDGRVHINDGTHPPLVEENNHPAIVDRELWNRAQDCLDRYTKGSADRNWDIPAEEVKARLKSLKGRIFCAECGHPMHPRYDKRSNLGYFRCYGGDTYGKEFCSNPTVPMNDIVEFDGITYISTDTDALGRTSHTYEDEAEWKKNHEMKAPPVVTADTETVAFEGLLFCGYCNRPLVRHIIGHRRVRWICNLRRKHECRGVLIADERVKEMKPVRMAYYFKEISINGKKYHSYTREDGRTGEIQSV